MIRKSFYRLSFVLLLLPLGLPGPFSNVETPISADNNKKEENKPEARVEMTDTMKYTPDTARVEVGETVIWTNSSLLAHSVTADPSQSTIEGSADLPNGAEPFDSGMLDPGETFEHTFTVPGTYQYFCIPHEGVKMYGWVIVKE